MRPGKLVQGSEFRVQRFRPTVQSSGFRAHRKSQRLRLQGASLDYEPSTLNQGGFTFVEIMIVLAVIGILVTMAQPSFSTSVWRAREATLQEDLFIFRDVIDQYYADQEEYPPTLEALVENLYLRKIPKDPITGAHDTWLVVYATNELGEEEGIFDVKSGSDMIATDATPYAEW